MNQAVTHDEVLHEFRTAGALLQGHFRLSSGRHSGYYLQCARVLMEAKRAARLAAGLVERLPKAIRTSFDYIVSPAMGGVILGHEVGRALGKPAVFVERPTGVFELRRGFMLEEHSRVLMVEDVVTTGLSSREAIAAVKAAGGNVVAEAALVDRTNGEVDLGVPFYSLIALDFPTYASDEVPAELAAIPVIKPGSRSSKPRHSRVTRHSRVNSASLPDLPDLPEQRTDTGSKQASLLSFPEHRTESQSNLA